jgi:trigger factor
MMDENIESIRMSFGTNAETDVVNEKSSVRGDFLQLAANGEKAEEAIVADGVLIAVDMMKDEEVRQNITGKKVGDVVIFDPVKTFGDRHEVGHMLNISHEAAEQVEGDFSFTIRSILDFQKAELNEELYKKVYGEESDIATEEKFREQVSEEIARNLSRSSDQKFAMDARENLLNTNEINLPEEFLKRWLKEVNKEMDDEQIEKDFPAFTRDLRWQLIKNSLIRDHEIRVEEEEVTALARQIAISQFQQYGIYQIQDEHLEAYVKRILESEEDRERMVRRLFEDKVFATIREKATIVEKEVSSDEFGAMMRNTTEEEA